MAAKILIVDDDRISVTLLKFTLKEKGYTVLEAGDGLEGIQAVSLEMPDLIILDVQMPRMSGYEFMNELRVLPGGMNVPVLMMTANETLQDVFFAEGVKGYFVKPVDINKLQTKIKELVGGT